LQTVDRIAKPGEKMMNWMLMRRVAHGVLAAGACAAAVIIFLAFPALADPGDALVQTKGMVDQALQVLRSKQLSLTDKRRQLRDMMEANFDFTDMSRSALGYHWRELLPDQRQEFSKLFSVFIEDAFLDRIQEYSGEDVEFFDQKSDGLDRVSVESEVKGENSDHPIWLTFRLEREGNGWKIYDLTIASVSIAANYRNQFNRVINDQGFDKLMSDLSLKQDELASLLGK
jgi:phospholipid transport system substrate-binding protein